jgi:prevent-host-death family protein
MSTTTWDSQAARDNWAGLLATVASGDQSIVITRQGEPVAALLDYAAFVALEEELDDLRAGQRAFAILEEIRAGRRETRPWDQVKAELIAEGLLDE